MKKILSLLTVGLFYFSTIFAQVNMDNYFTLTVATGKAYNFLIGGTVANTPIRISDGTTNVDVTVGTMWSNTSVSFTPTNSTVTFYGDIAVLTYAWAGPTSVTNMEISKSNTLVSLNLAGSATFVNGLTVVSSSLEMLAIEQAKMPFIDLTQAPKLQTAEFYSNNLKKLDISHNPDIRRVNIGNNLFTECGIDSLFHQLPINTITPTDVRDYRVNVSYAPDGVENNGPMQVAVDGCRDTIATNKNWRVTTSNNINIINEGYYTCPEFVYSGVELLNSIKFSLYPNPVKDLVTISAMSEIQKIQIYDLVGKLLLNVENINSNELTLPITTNPGTYIIKLSSKEGIGVEKIVVE